MTEDKRKERAALTSLLSVYRERVENLKLRIKQIDEDETD